MFVFESILLKYIHKNVLDYMLSHVMLVKILQPLQQKLSIYAK
jgi:hypothetical protein